MPKLRTAPKVMDVVHPNDRQPSLTSRPVVTNRPYMTVDPMLNSSKEDAIVPSVEQVVPTGAPEIDKSTINALTAKLKPATGPMAPTGNAEPARSESTSTEQDLVDVQGVAPEEPENLTSSTSSEVTLPEDARSQSMISDEAKGQLSELQSNTTSDITTTNAREEELEKLIAKGTYAVPINKVKRRRTRATLALIVVLLVIFVVLDLLADMNIITLPFGLPHTNFLAG